MSKLQELIDRLCPNGVVYKLLRDLCEIKTGKGITKKDASDEGIYPIISGGQTPMGMYHKSNRQANTITISRVGAYAGFVSFIKEDFYLNDKCFSVIPFTQEIYAPFLFYYLKHIEGKIKGLQSEGGVPTINTVKVGNLVVPVPPLEVQEEIVRILDIFSAHAAELQAELQARKEQYEYYRNLLLTFNPSACGYGTDDEQKMDNVTIAPPSSYKIIWKTMGEIGTFIRGNGLQKKDFTDCGVGCIHYGQIYTHYGTFATETKSFVSPEFAKKLRKAHYGDLIIATTSENVEDVGKAVAWLGKEEIAISGDSFIYTHSQNPKYIAYLLQTYRFLQYKRMNVSGTKVTRIDGNSLSKYIIPIPPIEQQERIVAILDRFETLVNDLTKGLPAEIAAVKERYEYYRNKLLTFKPITA